VGFKTTYADSQGKYAYTSVALKPGEFRLLSLKPPPEGLDPGPVLRCSLTVHALSAAPPFRALSYTCGPAFCEAGLELLVRSNPNNAAPQYSSNKDAQIECNGVLMKIYPNLYDALTNIQPMNGSDRLRADAICIRQDDIAERDSQVQMMGDIYAKATEVLVWLGPFREYRYALRLVEELSTAIDRAQTKACEVGPDRHTTLDQMMDETWLQKVGVKDFGPRLEGLLIILASSRWFTRLWTAQELILAKSALIVVGGGGGGNAVSWSCFANIMPFILFSPAGRFFGSKLAQTLARPMAEALGESMMRLWFWAD
jgi:Heterokaryon incompatibility protein (HET)